MGFGLPGAITRAPLRTFRPRDLVGVYAQPGEAVHRLARQGRVRQVAHGYYVAVPDDQDPGWQPTLEEVAAGIATAIHGERIPVLMHLSAARLHGALPRAVAVAVVAVPKQHDAIALAGERAGAIVFVKRDVDALDAVLRPLELGSALVTTLEQTALDLARRPQLGSLEAEALDAVRTLMPMCDPARLDALAGAQRMTATLRRIRADLSDDRVRR